MNIRYLSKPLSGIVFIFFLFCVPTNSFSQQSPPNFFNAGMSLYLAKNYPEAAKYFSEILLISPEHHDARYYFAWCLILMQQNSNALPHAQYLIRKFPDQKRYQQLISAIQKPSGSILSNSQQQFAKAPTKMEVVPKQLKSKAAKVPGKHRSSKEAAKVESSGKSDVLGDSELNSFLSNIEKDDSFIETAQTNVLSKAIKYFSDKEKESQLSEKEYLPYIRILEASGNGKDALKAAETFFSNFPKSIYKEKIEDLRCVKKTAPKGDLPGKPASEKPLEGKPEVGVREAATKLGFIPPGSASGKIKFSEFNEGYDIFKYKKNPDEVDLKSSICPNLSGVLAFFNPRSDSISVYFIDSNTDFIEIEAFKENILAGKMKPKELEKLKAELTLNFKKGCPTFSLENLENYYVDTFDDTHKLENLAVQGGAKGVTDLQCPQLLKESQKGEGGELGKLSFKAKGTTEQSGSAFWVMEWDLEVGDAPLFMGIK